MIVLQITLNTHGGMLHYTSQISNALSENNDVGGLIGRNDTNCHITDSVVLKSLFNILKILTIIFCPSLVEVSCPSLPVIPEKQRIRRSKRYIF